MLQLSQCLAELEEHWQDEGIYDGGELGRLFSYRAGLFNELKAVEEQILSLLQKDDWERLMRDGKGRDLLWELDRKWMELHSAGRIDKLPELIRTKIREVREFLLTNNYKEEDLGTQFALCDSY